MKPRSSWQVQSEAHPHDAELIILLLIVSALAGMAMRWYYVQQRVALQAATAHELTSVADAQRRMVASWRSERIGDCRVLASSHSMILAERVVVRPDNSIEETAALRRVFQALHEQFDYADVMLVDREGHVQLRLQESVQEQATWTRSQRYRLVQDAVAGGGCHFSDVTTETRARVARMALVVPAGNVGAVLLEIDVTRVLYPLVAAWTGSGTTGESFLVRRDGDRICYLSPLRHLPPGVHPPCRDAQPLHLPTDDQIDGGALIRGSDYRGAEVMLQARSIPGTRWFVAAKIDQDEVDAPMIRLARELGGVLAMLAVLNVGGVCVIWRLRQLRLQRESETKFRAIADSTPALLWMVSADHRSFFANRSLASFLGISESDSTVGWTSYIHPDEAGRVASALRRCLDERLPFDVEARLRRFDGTYCWVAGRGRPRLSDTAEYKGYTGVLLDITERKKAEQELQALNEVLGQQLEEKTQREAEIRALSAQLIDAQLEERTRLSRELHDDLTQEIAALSIGMGNLKRQLPADLAESRVQTDRLQSRLVEMSEHVRRISHQLHPSILNHSGIGAALQAYCREFEALSGIEVRFTSSGEFTQIPLPVAAHVYRIAQEALRNVARHASTKCAEVSLTFHESELQLCVSDNGIGMTQPLTGEARGIGLVSIRERARLVDGSVEISSTPGKGTRVSVRIPCCAVAQQMSGPV